MPSDQDGVLAHLSAIWSQPRRIYRDGELVCQPPPNCQAYTPPQLISNLNHNKIKLISTSDKQKRLTALINNKI